MLVIEMELGGFVAKLGTVYPSGSTGLSSRVIFYLLRLREVTCIVCCS